MHNAERIIVYLYVNVEETRTCEYYREYELCITVNLLSSGIQKQNDYITTAHNINPRHTDDAGDLLYFGLSVTSICCDILMLACFSWTPKKKLRQ